MLRKSYVGWLSIAALLVAPSSMLTRVEARFSSVVVQHGEQDAGDYTEKEELHQSFPLAAGGQVEVSRIRGPVEIETANITTAEIHIMRSARSRADLNFHRVSVEQTPTSLVVRGVQEDEPNNNVRVQHRVTLRLPRRVEIAVQSINGRTRIGEIEGTITVRSINGGLYVARASRHADIANINGGVTLTMAQLDARGISIRHVNGGIDLRFTDELNADLEVSYANGGITNNFTDVSMRSDEKSHRRIVRTRIGAGGTPINITHINGGVRLARNS